MMMVKKTIERRVRLRTGFAKRVLRFFNRRHIMLKVPFRKHVNFAAHQVWQQLFRREEGEKRKYSICQTSVLYCVVLPGLTLPYLVWPYRLRQSDSVELKPSGRGEGEKRKFDLVLPRLLLSCLVWSCLLSPRLTSSNVSRLFLSWVI
jgi:hypothetical protein